MDRALWLLMELRLRAWIRRLARNARTVKGVLILVAAVVFMSCMCTQPVVMFLTAGRIGGDPSAVVGARRYGPLALLAYCVVLLVTTVGEKAIAFSPAEVNLLFPAPFSRRQLLAYKIVSNGLLLPVTAAVMMVFFMRYSVWWLAAFVGLLLTLLFVQHLGIAVALVVQTVGAHAYGRVRKAVLLLLLLVPFVLVWQHRQELAVKSAGDFVELLESSPVAQVLLAPLRWFIETFTAERLWPDLALGVLRTLGVNAALLVLIFTLDTHFLETAAANSERLYAKLQQLRRGTAALAVGRAGRPKFSLPSLPYLAGVGPLVWRQLTVVVRGGVGLVLFLALLLGAMLIPVLISAGNEAADPGLAQGLAATLLGMTLFGAVPLLTCDFRGDVDRIDVLKSLPIAPAPLVVGQVLAPALVLSVVQLVLLTALELVLGGVETWLLAALAFVWPVNFVFMANENLWFLWFPTRQMASTPGDLQAVGRNILLYMAKFFTLGLLAGVVSLPTIILYFVGGWPAALALAWLLVVAFAVGMVPLLALAFRRFDVARDTPP